MAVIRNIYVVEKYFYQFYGEVELGGANLLMKRLFVLNRLGKYSNEWVETKYCNRPLFLNPFQQKLKEVQWKMNES